ncbi:hypothetical protein [Silvimonas iriomotensis]|uniref:Uncharacterized protein n=1 Tax=Silvimonas iriomotensis TaxID=449662 RepID=A0ABQ2P5Z5_9NEIS|nr:hypothetical protein [Silvimonas iriomotensis]GGP18955.1 hypothetical protein GCM10010970_08220 [Silvimonas iriomotensis]
MKQNQTGQLAQSGQQSPLVQALQEHHLPERWAWSDLAVELLADGLRLSDIVWRLEAVFKAGTVKDEIHMLSDYDTQLRLYESLLFMQKQGPLSADQQAELTRCEDAIGRHHTDVFAASLAGHPVGQAAGKARLDH